MSSVDMPFGHLVVHLLKGVVSRDDQDGRWAGLMFHQLKIQEYVRNIGLDVVIDESQGYAYVRQRHGDGDEEDKMPRLVPRRQLRYHVSLMLVLLRKRMVEHDSTTGEIRLIVTQEEIQDLCRSFLSGSRGEHKFVEQIDKILEQIVGLGFLRLMTVEGSSPERRFEVRRILKAYVDAQWLHDFSECLDGYRQHVAKAEEPA